MSAAFSEGPRDSRVDAAASGDILPEAVLGLIAFGILNYLPVLLGIAVFIAVLLALTRSYRDSEMTVWFTSGLSLAAWVKPVLQFALPVVVISADADPSTPARALFTVPS